MKTDNKGQKNTGESDNIMLTKLSVNGPELCRNVCRWYIYTRVGLRLKVKWKLIDGKSKNKIVAHKYLLSLYLLRSYWLGCVI